MTHVAVRTLADPAEHAAAAALFGDVWYGDGTIPIEAHLLTAVAYSGGYIAGAYDGDDLVGASLGLLGRHDGAWILHSHITGVRPGLEHAGIGRTIKFHQRSWAADHDLVAIMWTFDPLVRRNAWFNLGVLGAKVVDYVECFYGVADDALNTGDETDRAIVWWETNDPSYGGSQNGTPKSGSVIVDEHGERHAAVTDATTLNIHTPSDIIALRATDPGAAAGWRRTIRAALVDAFEDGWRITTIDRAGIYTLERP